MVIKDEKSSSAKDGGVIRLNFFDVTSHFTLHTSQNLTAPLSAKSRERRRRNLKSTST